MGGQSPKLFSENNHLVILTANPLFLGLCPKIGVAVGGWGSRVPNKYMEFCPKNCSFFQKKIKCSKQPKKQNKPNFHFSLSGVANVRGGWVGFDVWDKIPKKNNISFGTFPNCVVLIENSVQVKTRLPSSEPSSSFLSSSLSPFSAF